MQARRPRACSVAAANRRGPSFPLAHSVAGAQDRPVPSGRRAGQAAVHGQQQHTLHLLLPLRPGALWGHSPRSAGSPTPRERPLGRPLPLPPVPTCRRRRRLSWAASHWGRCSEKAPSGGCTVARGAPPPWRSRCGASGCAAGAGWRLPGSRAVPHNIWVTPNQSPALRQIMESWQGQGDGASPPPISGALVEALLRWVGGGFSRRA